MLFFNLIMPNNNIIEYKFSNITLKIEGPGFKSILSSSFNSSNYPDIIYINGNQNYTISNTYFFDEINNTVDLIWNNTIDSCSYMFSGWNDITEIDLSNFDTSNVINMDHMFDQCSKLSSLNLSNFDTSKVTSMVAIFA